jgi:phage gp16-like protein
MMPRNNTVPVTPGQIKKLHALKRACGLDDDTYRAMLEQFGAASSKDLSAKAMSRCLLHLEAQAAQAGVWEIRSMPQKTRRPGAASEAQVRLVRALWKQVSRQTTDLDRANALDALAKRLTGKPRLTWCGHQDIATLVAALEAMGAVKE